MQHPILLLAVHPVGGVTVALASDTHVRVVVRVRQTGALGDSILRRLVETLLHPTNGDRTLVLLGSSPRAGNALPLPVGTPVVRLPSLPSLLGLLGPDATPAADAASL